MSNIEWCDVTWNPTVGCSRVSSGCERCYAEKMANRLLSMGTPSYEGLVNASGRWTGKVRLLPERLDQPLRWRKPRRIFVDSMSDLFHEKVPDDYIRSVFEVMVNASSLYGHTFQVLTKRPERMRSIVSRLRYGHGGPAIARFPGDRHHLFVHRAFFVDDPDVTLVPNKGAPKDPWTIPPGIWLGTSCEDQETADERIPELLATPAAVRFVSLEPLLDAIRMRWFLSERFVQIDESSIPPLDWVIVGGESGPGARPCNVDWIRSIIEQCSAADVSCFVKQLGAKPFRSDTLSGRFACVIGDEKPRYVMGRKFLALKSRKGSDPSEWPKELRVREMPR